ncbi:DUF2171 domain-containing protein [Rhizobium sp. KVB221]|uniref:DUF2171 domain-containing protein n=1 Tax=Rhizobium setariae TaxID=2801340 RepID=A0A936YR20_9HYPH|nr:DUF2171 domain-containing protein [Rhizobium setariae]MBL0373202.1 DUF2171 domain-containing protein [Rhizobium setariae]
MIDASHIREHAEVITADGQHIGMVDRVEGNRIKLTKHDSLPGHADHHHFIDLSLVESAHGNRVRLSISIHDALRLVQEQDGGAAQE